MDGPSFALHTVTIGMAACFHRWAFPGLLPNVSTALPIVPQYKPADLTTCPP